MRGRVYFQRRSKVCLIIVMEVCMVDTAVTGMDTVVDMAVAVVTQVMAVGTDTAEDAHSL